MFALSLGFPFSCRARGNRNWQSLSVGTVEGGLISFGGKKVLNLTLPPKKRHVVYQREKLSDILTERVCGNTSY